MLETAEQRRKRALRVLAILKRAYASAKVSLDYKNNLQLLVATMLSAQCTDARVNMVTPALFRRYKTAADFASADIHELETLIRSTGFYHNKAKNIKAACAIMAEEFGGKVPNKMQDMLRLPGVARKTANIVLGNSYGVIEGVPVDTHAIRISYLLGFTREHAQEKIEKDLMALIPRKDWLLISNLFVHHGRAICVARRPLCSKCPLNKLCPKVGLRKEWMK
ncbi:G/T mismatches repair enzyme [uncultured archaeon]|nr:G/T mismatches repair enzyme [uncultured archaeon]